MFGNGTNAKEVFCPKNLDKGNGPNVENQNTNIEIAFLCFKICSKKDEF